MAKKEKKVVKEKKAGKPKKSTAKFISLTVGATIPTQAFGNIQPKIEVQADTYEDARDFAMPIMESLYKHYAELKPQFLGKITESVREVVPTGPVAPKEVSPAVLEKALEAPAAEAAPVQGQKSEPVKKAEKAIAAATTYDAVKIIEEQIMKSVKILPEEKPSLYELTLKRAKELKPKN